MVPGPWLVVAAAVPTLQKRTGPHIQGKGAGWGSQVGSSPGLVRVSTRAAVPEASQRV